ncbi:hypothetical protein [Kibdelosporangium philippinense]|uniref:hypothetical protein n=1 Tax=Kibdelosporangium philippinense TaxID=211113 RepID=UPI003619EF97
MQVRADSEGSSFVGGIDQPVEAFGGIRADRQQPNVIDLCRVRHRSTYPDPATMPRILWCDSEIPCVTELGLAGWSA